MEYKSKISKDNYPKTYLDMQWRKERQKFQHPRHLFET